MSRTILRRNVEGQGAILRKPATSENNAENCSVEINAELADEQPLRLRSITRDGRFPADGIFRAARQFQLRGLR